MDAMNPELKRILEAKEARRKQLAALPYPEKVRIIVEMQKRVAPIYRARGIPIHVWEIDDPTTTDEKNP